MKNCDNCKSENEDNLNACKQCGSPLKSNVDGIKVGAKTIGFLLVILLVIAFVLGQKIYDKVSYEKISLPDKQYNMDVVSFKIPKKWIPIGRVFYNPNSIPNLLTFFVAGVNPKDVVEFQFFSTQYETDDGKEFQNTGEYKAVDPQKYFTGIVKRLSPTATNIVLEKVIPPSKGELKKAKHDADFFNYIYNDINPGTTRGRSWLDNLTVLPVKYVFSYEEKGKNYKHLLTGRFVSFVQCFSISLNQDANIHTAIKFIKCEDVFSYKAEESMFKKNEGKFEVFRKNLVINPEWIEYSNSERRQKLLEKTSYITTDSLVGGDKFNRDEFKNMIYYIEYLDKASMNTIKDDYK